MSLLRLFGTIFTPRLLIAGIVVLWLAIALQMITQHPIDELIVSALKWLVGR